jgi:GTPase-activating protein SAC7
VYGVNVRVPATNVEGIFRLSGAEKRIKELVVIFNSPDRYGKGLDWDGYTVHDAANVLRRYLNQLPEPIVPLDLYNRFRDPLRGHALEAVGDQEASQASEEFDLDSTILKYQQLITELPPLNRQLLLYILDLLAVFASKSDENRMTSQNLAAIFQPGMLSHPAHDMAPAEYRLSQDVLVFLIENQDHFLIGMRGTAADEKTVQDVQNGGTPPLPTPSTPTQGKGSNTVGRSASNASAGADSLRRQGGVRRNVSVNSRHSRQSNGAPSPASPAFGGPLTQTTSGGVHRSNTVPSKKSPGISSSRLQKPSEARSPTSPAFQQTPASTSEIPPEPISKDTPVMSSSMASTPTPAKSPTQRDASPMSSSWTQSTVVGTSSLVPTSNPATAGQSQDKLLPDPPEVKPETTTPVRDRTFFHRSPTAESDKKQPNKLRKKRNVSSNPSAQSSSNSLNGPSGNDSPAMPVTRPTQEVAEHPHLASILSGDPTISHTHASPVIEQEPAGAKLAPVPARPDEVHRSSDGTLKPQNSSQSLRSRGESMNEQSDMDNIDDPVVAAEQKEKRRRWRLSRRKDESLGANLTSPKKGIGANGGADTSTTSFNSGRGRKSFTADTIPAGSDSGMASTYQQTSNDSGPSYESGGKEKEEKKGNPIDWFKRKMQEAKEEKRERDAEREKEKAGKGERRTSTGEARGKSMDMRRSAEKETEAPAAPAA